LRFQRGTGPAPENVHIPATLGNGWRFSKIAGAEVQRQGEILLVTPGAASWEAFWRA